MTERMRTHWAGHEPQSSEIVANEDDSAVHLWDLTFLGGKCLVWD